MKRGDLIFNLTILLMVTFGIPPRYKNEEMLFLMQYLNIDAYILTVNYMVKFLMSHG